MVTGYATYLDFQARGTPDLAMINEFAAISAEGVASIFIGVGTLVGGLFAGRKAQEDQIQNGLMVGILAVIISLVLSIFGGFSLWAILSLILAMGGGWLGGKLSSSRS